MAVGPQDLALGVLHTQDRRVLQLLLPDPASFPTLCRALGGSVEPAPVIAEDVSYEASAREALDGATRIAAAMASGPDTHPVHILLGILRPWSVDGSVPVEAGATALTLAATGLGETRLLALLPQVLALGTAHQA